MDWLVSAGTALVTIGPLELPDKTFVATLVLATRYRGLLVWLGVAGAFAVHVTVAVTAGSLVTLLPATPVRLAAAGLFATGAVILFVTARRADAERRAQQEHYSHRSQGQRRGWAALATSFVLLFTAEWGDLSQLVTVGLVASGEPPTAVFVGAWGALLVVSGAAVLLGRWILARVRLALVRYAAAAICAGLAAVTVVAAF